MFFIEDSEHFATEREREHARQARVKRGAHIANLRYLTIVDLLVGVILVLPYVLTRSLARRVRKALRR